MASLTRKDRLQIKLSYRIESNLNSGTVRWGRGVGFLSLWVLSFVAAGSLVKIEKEGL